MASSVRALTMSRADITQRRFLVAGLVFALLASVAAVVPAVAPKALGATTDLGPPLTVTYYVSDGQGGDASCGTADTSTGNYADDALAIQDALYLAATDGTSGIVVIHLCAGSFDLSSGISVTTGDDTEIIFEGEGTANTTVTRSVDAPIEFGFFTVTGIPTTFRDMTVAGAAGGASRDGGAVKSDTDVTADTAVFRDNTTGGSGGAIYASGGVTVRDGTFTGNSAASSGGAIYASGGVMSDPTLYADNTAGSGGAIWAGGDVTTIGDTFERNSATSGDGGAIYASTGVTVSDGTFTDNSAGANGGAIAGLGVISIATSTFDQNSATGEGGAVHGDVTIVNSTFVGNQAASGGALSASTAEITNGTFWDNTAATVGDHLSVTDGSGGGNLVSTDSIYDGGDCVIDQTTATGRNLATDLSCPNDGNTVSSSHLDLQPLADNGGPTFTVALGMDSVAIDATSGIAADNVCAVDVDQRGVPRPQMATCDVGAFELWFESAITTQASIRGVDLTSGVPSITSGDLVTDVATVTGSATDGSGGRIDPTSGSVNFYYCYDPTTGSNPITECTSGTTWTFAGNDEMSGGTSSTDGIATATLEDWSPPNGGGWYLISAVYDSSGGTYGGSETTGDTVHELIRVLYDTTTATVVDPTTGGYNQTYTDGIKVYGLAPHPSGTPGEYLDPTGKVRMYYCFNLNAMPTDCSAGSGYPITTLSLTDGTSGTDGIGEATLSSWLPPQAGYYLLHAVYRGDDVYAPSADDGSNEEIFAAYTTVVYTGETYDSVTDGTTRLSATITGPSVCVVGSTVTFTIRDITGNTIAVTSGDVTTPDNTAGAIATLPAGIYEVEATAGSGGGPCSGGTDVAILTVVVPGQASNGGGHYRPDKTGGTQWSGNPRVNFGYAISKSTKKSGTSTITTYRGQLIWLNKGQFRIKGTMFSQTTGTAGAYGTFACPAAFIASLPSSATGYKCGSFTGTGVLQQWSDAYGWVSPGIFPSAITFTGVAYDAGQLKQCKGKGKLATCVLTEVPGDWFGIQVNEVPFTAIRESAPTKLSGGALRVL